MKLRAHAFFPTLVPPSVINLLLRKTDLSDRGALEELGPDLAARALLRVDVDVEQPLQEVLLLLEVEVDADALVLVADAEIQFALRGSQIELEVAVLGDQGRGVLEKRTKVQ